MLVMLVSVVRYSKDAVALPLEMPVMQALIAPPPPTELVEMIFRLATPD